MFFTGRCASLRTRNHVEEGQMAIDMREIVGAMGGEIGERYVHQKLSEHLREEIAKGESSHDVVAKAIIRLRNSEFLQVMRGLLGPRALGLGLTGLGAGIAKVLQTMNFDSLLPEDQSHVMREVRYVLQSLAPALIVGSIDGATDSWEEDVHAAVAKVRSNDRVPEPQKRGALDEVYEILSTDGIDYTREYGLLFPEWDANGQLQHDALGAVILAGPNGKRFAEDWYKTHKGGEKEVPIDPPPNDQNQNGRGRGNQNQQQRFRKIQVPPEPYKGRLVPLPVAITRVPVSVPMDPELVALAKAALTPKDPPPEKKEGLDALNDKGRAFTFIISRSLAVLPEHEQRYLRDFIQDIAKNAKHINMLGDEFAGKEDVDGRFKKEDVDAIVQHVQTWMGATLTFENKIRQALARAKHVLEGTAGVTTTVGTRVETAIGEVAGAAGKIALASLFGLTVLFAMFLVIVLLGAFGVNLDRPLAVSWVDSLYFVPVSIFMGCAKYFKNWLRFLFVVLATATGIPAMIFLTANVMGRLTPSEFAIALVAGGGILACLELFSFTAIQGLLSLVTRFLPDIHKDWLVNKGRILIMFIGIHVGIFMILLAVKTPLMLRLLICVPTFFALASQMGLSGYEFGEEARQRARKTMWLFSSLATITFIVFVAVIILQNTNTSFKTLWSFVAESHIVQFVLCIIIGGPVVALAARWLHIKERKTTNGVVTEIIRRPPNKWIWGGAILFLLIIATWTWTGKYIDGFFDKKNPSMQSTASSVTAPKSPISQPILRSSVPAAVQEVVPAQVPAKRAAGKRQKKTGLTAEECAEHSYEWRQELECP